VIDTAVCVWKDDSTDFSREYVNRLMNSLSHYSINRICLTDVDAKFDNCQTEKLQHRYQGWWSKIELFDHPALESRNVLYLDLDTIVKDDITHLLEYDHQFTMLRDFMKDRRASGVMCYKFDDYKHIAENFSTNLYDRYKTADRWGDQGYISEQVTTKVDFFQDLFPNLITSYKMHKVDRVIESSIVCFHGKPRPHEVNWNPLCKHRLQRHAL